MGMPSADPAPLPFAIHLFAETLCSTTRHEPSDRKFAFYVQLTRRFVLLCIETSSQRCLANASILDHELGALELSTILNLQNIGILSLMVLLAAFLRTLGPQKMRSTFKNTYANYPRSSFSLLSSMSKLTEAKITALITSSFKPRISGQENGNQQFFCPRCVKQHPFRILGKKFCPYSWYALEGSRSIISGYF
jgi:hypothetical protein